MLKALLKALPQTATAPFCPSEIQSTVAVPQNSSYWKKLFIFAGPGLLISVGYMDPGNWATDIEAGSRFGYALLSIVLLSSLAAIILQCLSQRVGLITQRDLAQLCHDQYAKPTRLMLWGFAEIAIVACDVAEVLGSALAFKLLFGCSLTLGIAITALDTVIILGLKGRGFRQIEAIILGLIMTIAICFFAELIMIGPHWPDVFAGFIPRLQTFTQQEPWYLAVGILGATVMPHNLYLHSSIVQTRDNGRSPQQLRQSLQLGTIDTVASLTLAFLVNAAILILASSAFHHPGQTIVTTIDDAYHLLDPVVSGGLASLLFGIALLASGQSSTFTGTIAGQILLDGFLNLKIPCWKRRVITRTLALLPALLGIWILGENSVGRLLVISQIVLSFQLPFAIYPLIKFNSNRKLMGEFTIGTWQKITAWLLFAVITAANLWLVIQFLF